ncbi:uncharacterized protein LOC112593893 [Melanaphis sacchari]|uniref:uncharacterized protein LOC112593893 n=1 Tax=Melanaphis sacchari TaxID=742174 RepID=UPI000DC150F5|nr:uncharacterized protein LOC112593893 [Melanaphis sacchari]
MSDNKKRKGGAEREREKSKKLLMLSGKQCMKLDSYFGKRNPVTLSTDSENISDHNNLSFETDHTSQDINEFTNDEKILDSKNSSSALMQLQHDTPVINPEKNVELNKFKKPNSHNLMYFFQIHPVQPSDDSILPFSSKKVFFRNNKLNRNWCTYNEHSKQIFCSVCLAFSTDSNAFTNGMSDWKHVYQRISEHEASKCHMQCSEAYFMHVKQKNIGNLLLNDQKRIQREEVKKNRAVLERIIEVIKVIGKRGLSIRSKNNEAAYLLNDPILDHGNFLEMIILLNNVVTSISSLIKSTISNQIKQSDMFSVLIDTTQDISVMDQCSIVLRYVIHGEINEKLVAVKCCTDSTGEGMMKLLQSALFSLDINITRCIGNATDGAANMQGMYKGFTSWLSKTAPEQVHVWCYSHVLNLVICDATKNPVKVATFFSIINSCAVFFKESYQRMNIWKSISNNHHDNIRNKRLQIIGETRWTAKQTALNRIFGTYDKFDDALYTELIICLSKISNNEGFKPDIRSKANCLLSSLLKYENILIAHMFMKIFSITGPLSRYLQTSGLDLLKCQQMVEGTLKQIEKFQRDMENIKITCDKFIEKAQRIIDLEIENTEDEKNKKDLEMCDIQDQFENKRIQRKKRMSTYETKDEPIINAAKKFEVEVYNKVFDAIIRSMTTRFIKNNTLYFDLSLLSPNNFESFKNGIPKGALSTLSLKLKSFIECNNDVEQIKSSLYSENSDDKEDSNSYKIKPCKSCQNCPLCCYKALIKYSLFSNTYPTLMLAYQFLLTLPVTQVACERSFSTLKYIKNRLRSTMSNEHLENFMLMAIEKKTLVELNNDEIINSVGEKRIENFEWPGEN